MNKLKRDIRLRFIGQLNIACSFVGLGLFKLIQRLAGLSESEMYKRYPASWWVAISLGFIFLAGLIYAVKKSVDIHPNIQLRSKNDSVLKEVLADTEYTLWHPEAQRLLDQRGKTQQNVGT